MDDAGMPDASMDPVDEPVLPTQILTVSRSGTGTGSISSLPLGIACGATCQHAFAEGVSVTLKATPGANSRFVGWVGDCAASGTSDCALSMDRARNASATFELASRTMTVSVTGETLGNVVGVAGTSQVVNCGNLGTDCTETLAHGASVVLTATPATNMQFTWGGVCAGVLTANCTVPMDGAKFVSVTFSPIQYTLTFVTKDQGIAQPYGYGTVTMVSPATGFVCQNDYLNLSMQCTHVFNAGTVVQLHAQGQGYDAFMAWGGACAAFTVNQDCVLTMNGNLSAFADFAGVIP